MPGSMSYKFEDILDIVSEIECLPYEFVVGCLQCETLQLDPTEIGWSHSSHTFFIQAKLWRLDTDAQQEGWGFGSRHLIYTDSSVSDIVKRCFVAARDYAEHEVREAFLWRGRRILGPHIDIEDLYAVAINYKPQGIPVTTVIRERIGVFRSVSAQEPMHYQLTKAPVKSQLTDKEQS